MSTDSTHPIAYVTGATSQIGRFLIPRLQTAGFTVIAVSREPPSTDVVWHQADLQTSSLPITQPSQLFHIAPLTLLPPLLARLSKDAPLRRVIAFSSTSCLTKANSPESRERKIAAQLMEAETALKVACQARGIAWNLFRPTLIYGCGIDKNVTFIAQFIRRFGFFPLVGQGTGLRQPVHADDLAAACLQANQSQTAVNKIYNLSGGETLNYRDMVKAIFHQLGKKPHLVSIPLPVFKLMIRCITLLPVRTTISMAMIMRMNQDLCFDHTTASHDFGYNPRIFSENEMGF